MIFKPLAKAFHGDARFASRGDLARAGLLKATPDGGIIGKSGGSYLYLGGTQHIIVTAPTRTGKATCVAIPVLLSYRHSIVCLDQGRAVPEHQRLPRRHRPKIYKFAPYAENGGTPLMAASGDPRVRIGELQTISAILYADAQGEDPFWTSQARTAFVAIASDMFERWDHLASSTSSTSDNEALEPNISLMFPSFERIYNLTAGDAADLKAYLQKLVNEPFVSTQTRAAFTSLATMADQTLPSVIATMQAPLQQFLSPILAAATNASDFNVDILRRRPTTIYNEELIVFEGCRPIRCKKNWYFKDRFFKKQIIDPVVIRRVDREDRSKERGVIHASAAALG